MPPTPKTPFALFVSSVEGRAVSRFGTATGRQANELIGARRSSEGPIVWDTEAITALSAREAEAFSKEYRDAIAEGSLVKRTEEAYLAWVAAQHARAAKAEEKAAEPAAAPVQEPAAAKPTK